MIKNIILFIRSTIFNILFYGATGVLCLLCLPGLLLPKPKMMFIVYTFVQTVWFLERTILGLKFEVIGEEYLPKDGSFVIAAKHQSPYETMKLHVLFKDPAVVLKQELLNIPIWGKFLKKSDPIAIDRSQGKASMAQILDEAKRIKPQSRPIIIFPQGTRVYPWTSVQERPYKIGAVRIQDALDIPIIPLAMNTGIFWPRSSWLKGSGTITFEFLPPIEKQTSEADTLRKLEQTLEDRSLQLAYKATKDFKMIPAPMPPKDLIA